MRPTRTGPAGSQAAVSHLVVAARPAGAGWRPPSTHSGLSMWKVGSFAGADAGQGLGVAAVVAADHHHQVEAALVQHASAPRPGGPGWRSRWCPWRGSARRRSSAPWRSTMAARSISWISRLSLISIVVWLARPMRARSRSGSKPGLAAWREARGGSRPRRPRPRMKAQTTRRLLAVAHAEVVAALVGEGLRGGGLGLLVVVLAVDDGGEAVARVLVHVLPDVQHAAAGGVHQHAALAAQVLHLRHRDAERGQDHHVARGRPPRSARRGPSPRAGCGCPCASMRPLTSGLWMISPERKMRRSGNFCRVS